LTAFGNEPEINVLLMDVSGRVYSAFEEYLDLLADSGDEALERITSGQESAFQRILSPPENPEI
jgi:hypothetical protein